MRIVPRLLLAAIMALVAGDAAAHQLVDIAMSIQAPQFVATRQPFSYRVIADNRANDSAFGAVVATTLPPGVTFGKASGTGWSCSESKLKVTCSAEEVHSGVNVITIDVTAPAARATLTASTTVTTLGSFDPTPSNDTASATITFYDAAACSSSSLQLLPVTSTDPAQLAWTAVPNAQSYALYAAVEGERSTLIATTTATSVAIPFERGQVDWHIEAILGNCPTLTSDTGHFLSTGHAAAIAVTNVITPFVAPTGVAIDSAGDLYVADAGTYSIARVSHGVITRIAGTQSIGAVDGRPGSFAAPMGIAITPADDFLYIADRDNQAVRLRYPGDLTLGFVITIGGALTKSGMVDGPFEITRFSAPSAVAADPRGRLYVADTGNNRIRKMETVPGYVGYYTSATFAEGLHAPEGVAVDGEDVVYVADTGNDAIVKLAGGVATTFTGFDAPAGIAVDARGNLYVCNGDGTIRKLSPSGAVTIVARGFNAPRAIAIDANGTIYIADTGNGRVAVANVSAPAGPRRRVAR
jgi:sugar lactone lactonase YvrE